MKTETVREYRIVQFTDEDGSVWRAPPGQPLCFREYEWSGMGLVRVDLPSATETAVSSKETAAGSDSDCG